MSTQQAVSQDHWVDHLKDIIEFTKKEISQTKGKRKLADLNRSLSLLRQQLREAQLITLYVGVNWIRACSVPRA
jgi:hypothetical protein